MAAWIRYTGGRDRQGQAYQVDDPLAWRFAELHARHAADVPALVAAFLGMDDVVPPALAAAPGFAEAVTEAYRTLTEHGLDAALAAMARA